MTANIMRDDRKKCIDAVMNGHIARPVDTNRVVSDLQQYFL